jgi:phosphoserine phosphatase
MIDQIIPIQDIVDDARLMAEAGHPVVVCPFPEGSTHAARWKIAFYAREQELRAEVEI